MRTPKKTRSFKVIRRIKSRRMRKTGIGRVRQKRGVQTDVEWTLRCPSISLNISKWLDQEISVSCGDDSGQRLRNMQF
jgi:hypothetical protein